MLRGGRGWQPPPRATASGQDRGGAGVAAGRGEDHPGICHAVRRGGHVRQGPAPLSAQQLRGGPPLEHDPSRPPGGRDLPAQPDSRAPEAVSRALGCARCADGLRVSTKRNAFPV
eukprot:4549286-Pyramimonas_sp.AAC.1